MTEQVDDIIHQALPSGYELDEYLIEKEIGSGGFGITYRARDKHLDRLVAIKEYFPFNLASRASNLSVSPKTRVQKDVDEYQWGLERFIQEAKALALFEHPNIIRVIRYIERNSTAYIIMEYAEGNDLAVVMKEKGVFSVDTIKQFVVPIAEGLVNVHKVGMLHRDIKPANIRIRQETGQPVLIDFGAARQAIGVRSKSISTVLTPGYAPIEQYSSRGNQGPWTDIYALAAVAYVALTHENLSNFEATERIRHDDLPKLVGRIQSDDATFLAALDWALSPEEKDRPQTVEEWLAVIMSNSTQPVVETHISSQLNQQVDISAAETSSSPSSEQNLHPAEQASSSEHLVSGHTSHASFDAFISYASPDKEKAFKICDNLEAKGVRCWIAPRNVRAGKEYTEEIIRGLDRSQNVVLILSDAANKSIFVKREIERAISYNKAVFPVRIENVMPVASLELLISSSHWIDAFQGRLDTHTNHLADALQDTDDEPVHTHASVSLDRSEDKKSNILIMAVGAIGLLVAAFLVYLAFGTGEGNKAVIVKGGGDESFQENVAERLPPPTTDATPKVAPVNPPKAVSNPKAAQDFRLAERINTVEGFEIFLRLYPNSTFAERAQQKIRQLRQSN